MILLTGAAAALRLQGLAREPLWIDEAATLRFAELPQALLWGAALDTNPPLYYALQRLWLVFGDSETALRTLPVLIGTLTVPVVYLLGRRVAGTTAGLVAAALLATAPLHILYSQEARAYVLLMLLLATATLGLVGIVASWRRGAAPRAADWALYVLASAAALYTHNTAVLYPAIANLALLVLWLGRGPRDPGFALRWIAANAVILALWSWWLPVVLNQSGQEVAAFWLKLPGLVQAAGTVLGVYGAPFAWPAAHAVGVAVVALGLWGAGRGLRRDDGATPLLLGFVALTPALTYAISLGTPVFMLRTLMWPLFAWLVLVAIGIVALGRRGGAIAAAGLIAIQLWSVAVALRTPFRQERWDALAATIAREAAPGDLVLDCAADAALPLDYYLRRAGIAPAELGVTAPDEPAWRRNLLRPPVGRTPLVDVAAAPASVEGHRRLWLVTRLCDHETALLDGLSARYAQTGRWEFGLPTLARLEAR